MKLPKALMEAINETTDALEQAASGLFDPKAISLTAEWTDSSVGNFRVTLTSDGGYSSDWDIDVEPIPDNDLEATGPKEPLILANPPRKAVPQVAKRVPQKRVQGSATGGRQRF